MFFKFFTVILLILNLFLLVNILYSINGIEEQQQVALQCCQKNVMAIEESKLLMTEFYNLFVEYPDDSMQFKEEHKKILHRLGRLLGMFCR